MEQAERLDTLDVRQIAEQLLLNSYAPPGVVANAEGRVLSLHGRTRDFIATPAVSAYNAFIAAVAHDDLRKAISETLRLAAQSGNIVTSTPQYFTGGERPTFITVTARPLTASPANDLFLITFDDAATIMNREEARMQITRTLQQSEQRYKQIAQAVTDYMYSVTVENGAPSHTQHGANCVAITGYTAQEYYANPLLWIDMVHSEDRDMVIAHADGIIKHKVALPYEHRIIHKNGSVRWVKNTTVIRTDAAGNVTGYDGLVSDITERKEAELHLRESEELFRIILEQSPLGVTLANSHNRIVKANAVFCEMLSYEESELRRMTTSDITPPEDMAKEEELMKSLQGGIVQVARVEKRLLTKSHDVLWVNLHLSLIRNAKGNFVFTLGIVENITTRKQAEASLRNSEAKLSALLQNSNDAMVITDAEGRFTYVSPSSARLFYYGPSALIGKHAFQYIHPDDRDMVRAAYQTLVEMPLNAMKTYRYRFRRADGSWARVESVSANLLKHALIHGIVTNTRDISERHETLVAVGDDEEEDDDE